MVGERKIVYAEDLVGEIDMEYSDNPVTWSCVGRDVMLFFLNPYDMSAKFDAEAAEIRKKALERMV